jgi:EAL domain-containing protein (putative c-di-GMP-specific phosphodiesterase class I)
MITASARHCRQWQASGADIKVSVNISLSSLNKPSFADRITELVRDQRLDPRHMILEITESTAMTNVAQALENLARLRIKGFGLSIDDYGTGYSSMQQLTRVSFTELKIDQSFVSGAFAHPACRVVLEASLDIARKLHLTTVAEGVESLEDWRILRQLNCDIAQGFFIAEPMPGDAFPTWMMAWTPPKN